MKNILNKKLTLKDLLKVYVSIVYTIFGFHYLLNGSSLELSVITFEGVLLFILGVMAATKWREDISMTPFQIFRVVAFGWMILWAFALLVSIIPYYKQSINDPMPIDVSLYLLFVGSAYLFSFAEAMEKAGKASLAYGLSTALFGLSLIFGFGNVVIRLTYYFISGLILYRK